MMLLTIGKFRGRESPPLPAAPCDTAAPPAAAAVLPAPPRRAAPASRRGRASLDFGRTIELPRERHPPPRQQRE
jgi:hypothetical protein